MKVHEVFHVSFLKRYVKDAYHVIDWYGLQVELEVNSIENLSAYCNRNNSCYETEQSSKLKCNGSILGSKKLHWR